MQRSDRVAEEIKKILADAIRQEIKDPRMPAMVSVTQVKSSKDLSIANIWVSTLGGAKEKADLMACLKSASGFLRRKVATELRLRVAPELRFNLDESIEHGIEMSSLIDQVLAEDAAQASAREAARTQSQEEHSVTEG